MFLVDHLPDEWGVEELSEGKQIWFRLALGGAWHDAAECSCGGANVDAVRLGSGRLPWLSDDLPQPAVLTGVVKCSAPVPRP